MENIIAQTMTSIGRNYISFLNITVKMRMKL